VEILYNLRLGSELDCKYGPDLEIKHFFLFQVKEVKSTQKHKEEETKRENKATEAQQLFLE